MNFRAALAQRDFAQTYQVGHPGVITMWLGMPSMPSDPTGKWQEMCLDANVSRILKSGTPDTLAELTGYLFAARSSIAVLTAASAVVVYFVLRQLLNRRTALIPHGRLRELRLR